MDADTANRELSIARKAIGWWQRRGGIERDPTIGIERRPAPPDRTKALLENQIAALWRLDVSLPDKTCWKVLDESTAKADEVLCLNVEDLHPGDKHARNLAKGNRIMHKLAASSRSRLVVLAQGRRRPHHNGRRRRHGLPGNTHLRGPRSP
ncbi:hypothetical protein OG413_42865 [Streptomyces sp. NBC_01433]|uniref:hypothetical protein n=1 Tax=Streptomyces sp. NBC_01433 TaxID=2903864 RepID=UPI00224FD215|nr:hypothetical protein [Streptomyces sp. NBC_01433]MCX4681942.1 hypothetical protein [Streptomyces sp. NBC_01433]